MPLDALLLKHLFRGEKIPKYCCSNNSNDLLPLPTCRFDMLNSFAWVWLRWFCVLGNEWIRILLLVQVSQRMIDLPVLRFIRPNIEQQVPHRLFSLRHIPVPNRNLWCLQSLPSGEFAFVNVLNCHGVRFDGLLFDVADKAVAGLRRNQVGNEET